MTVGNRFCLLTVALLCVMLGTTAGSLWAAGSPSGGIATIISGPLPDLLPRGAGATQTVLQRSGPVIFTLTLPRWRFFSGEVVPVAMALRRPRHSDLPH